MALGRFRTDAPSVTRKYAFAQLFLMFMAVLASGARLNIRAGQLATPQIAASSAVQGTPTQISAPNPTPPVTNPPPNTAPSTAPSSTSTQSSLTQPTSTGASATLTTLSTTSPSTASTPSITPTTQSTSSVGTTTDSGGSVQTIVVGPSSSDSSPSESPTPSTSSSGGSSSHTGTIIGLAVAGGVAAIALIAFFIWKVTRKRFSDLDDHDEAIKWPELNRPNTEENQDMSRQLSHPYPSGGSGNPSLFDQTELADPYAVPPLPQFNPNQPYRDDPAAASNARYYDPYRGPAPQSFTENSADGHESYQMNTYPPLRTRSPGPMTAYDTGGRGSPALGRQSPGPGVGYDAGGRVATVPGRTTSPGPAAALG